MEYKNNTLHDRTMNTIQEPNPSYFPLEWDCGIGVNIRCVHKYFQKNLHHCLV